MDQLPTEIKRLIINYLNDTSRRILRATCRQLFNMIDYRNFALYLTKKEDWPQIAARLSSYNKPIGLKFTKNIMNRLSDMNEHLLKLTNLTSLEFDYLDEATIDRFNEQEWLKLTALSNLQSIHSNEGYIFHVPSNLLYSLPNLTKFDKCFYCQNFSYAQLAQNFQRWTNLQICRLEQNIIDDINMFNGCHTKLTSLSIDFPHVKISTVEQWFKNLPNVVDLTIQPICFPESNDNRSYISLKSLTALQRLKITDQIWQLDSPQIHQLNSSRLTFLSILHIDETVIEKELHQLVNLKHLEIELWLDPNENIAPVINDDDEELTPNFKYQWLTAMTDLEHLKIRPIQNDALDFVVSSKLTSLHVTVDNEKAVDLSHVSKFDMLKGFTVLSPYYIIDISSITILTKLDSLGIEFKQRIFNDFLLDFSNLTSLSLSVKAIELDHLPNLESLILSVDQQHSGLTDLPKLTHLQIQLGAVKDGFEFISKLSTLKVIDIRNTDTLPCGIFSTLTDLESISFWETLTTDFDKLSALTRLKKLTIGRAAILDTLLHLPTSLQNLRINHAEDPAEVDEENDTSALEKDILARLPNVYTYTFHADSHIF